jgi:uncharacterized membrane-anchored protein YitT (DUF2179 family)
VVEKIRKHTWFEDLFGLATGVLLISCGIGFMEAGGLLTGGTVGLSQLAAKSLGISLSILYIAISVPFFILAIWKLGFSFAAKSFVNILAVSYLVSLFPKVITIEVSNQLAAAVIANTLAGMGVLAIFRHNSSLAGLQVVALLGQAKLKIQAGYIQAAIDLAILAIGLSEYSLSATLNSVVGVVIFNGILAINHRPDLYIGRSD